MEPYQNNDFPWRPYPEEPETQKPKKKKKREISGGIFACILCLAVAVSILLTYTLTANRERAAYHEQLLKQQQQIEELKNLLENGNGDMFRKLDYLSLLFETASYYGDSIDREAILEAVLKAYVKATGDDYAEYYTEEEYAAILKDSSGSSQGIGISVINTELTVNGQNYQVYEVIAVYQNAPAATAGIKVGDYIYSIKVDGKDQTIAELGGYSAGLSAMRGESGTTLEFSSFRKTDGGYESLPFAVKRSAYIKESVSYKLSESDPTVGIVRIAEFDMTTPTQFKTAVNTLLEQGAEHFVFDVRQNPGGDLQSIKAVLSYILEDGDLILSSIDNKGETVKSYYAEVQTLSGSYASCSVSAEELGMYRDLDMVVLCDHSTASAAEVFTASLRDHKNVPIVGVTTYGKGIMQGFYSLALYSYGVYDGWLKLTTYAYVTECGEPYHKIGIQPTVPVELDDAAKEYHFYAMPESVDNQLQTAISTVKQ